MVSLIQAVRLPFRSSPYLLSPRAHSPAEYGQSGRRIEAIGQRVSRQAAAAPSRAAQEGVMLSLEVIRLNN